MRIGIVGAGPAGAFCALRLCEIARKRGLPLEVSLFDPKTFEKAGRRGCNLCAGLIFSDVVRQLESHGFRFEEGLLQRPIHGFLLKTGGGEETFRAPHGRVLYSVFRGAGPKEGGGVTASSFDRRLIALAEAAGARLYPAEVSTITRAAGADGPLWIIRTAGGETHEFDFLVGAFGVNSPTGALFENLGFGYRRPATQTALQAEFRLDPDFIDRTYRNLVVVFNLGLKKVRLAALTPKHSFVTVTLIGDDPGWPSLTWLLRQPEMNEYLPHAVTSRGFACTCRPVLPVSSAKDPVGEGVAVIGDANTSRYYKNGIGSAFISAEYAASAIVAGAERRTLERRYAAPCRRRFHRDNVYGRILFAVNDRMARSAFHSSVCIECSSKISTLTGRTLNRCLWGLYTGDIAYAEILRKLLSPIFLGGLALEYAERLLRGAGKVEGSPLDVLRNGGRVAIIGGGVAGCSAALTLLREARRKGKEIKVLLIEPKVFGTQYNQCLGVLTPPLRTILEQELQVPIPDAMVRRVVKGYRLWSDEGAVELEDVDSAAETVAIRRVELDHMLLELAEARGARVIQSRVTGVEVHPEDVILFTDSGTHSADVVIGAFGLDDSMQKVFEREVGYWPPGRLESCVIKLHPADPGVLDGFRGNIEAFLLPVPGVLFAAIVPKGDHLSIVAAGRRLTTRRLISFLELPHVKRLLEFDFRVGAPFKGSFPNGPARHFYGNRYVMVGDATGLVRPFKGKGINSAAITGIRAAETIMNEGISREAFRKYAARCRHLAGSVWSGRLAQWLTVLVGRTAGLGPLVRFASSSRRFRAALFGAVSGMEDYKDVLLVCFSPPVAAGIAWSYLAGVVRRIRRKPEQA